MKTRLNLSRGLLIFGFLYGMTSLLATFNHIGDPAYLVQVEFGGGQAHSWYHALREAFGDIATIAVMLYLFLVMPGSGSPIPGGLAWSCFLVTTCPTGRACLSWQNWLLPVSRPRLTTLYRLLLRLPACFARGRNFSGIPRQAEIIRLFTAPLKKPSIISSISTLAIISI